MRSRGRSPAPALPTLHPDPSFWEHSAPRLSMPDWVERHRVVVTGPRRGRWSHLNAPMSVEPMLALTRDGVRQVTVGGPSQLLKSELCINAAAYFSSYGDDVGFWEPDLPLLKQFVGDRIRGALVALHGDVRLEGLHSAALKKRDSAVALRMPGAGTVLGLTPEMKTGQSAHTFRVAIADELDKMATPQMVTVMRERTTVYGSDARILLASTFTTDGPGTSWRQWSGGSRGVWRGLCRHCGELASMDWERVDFRQDDDGFWIPRWGPGADEVAALVCEHCGVRWSEADRIAAVHAGVYVHDEPDHWHQSFRVPGPAHLWRTVEWMAEAGAPAYRAALEDGAWQDYQQWVNGISGRPWTAEDRGLSRRKLERTTYSLGARGADDLGALDPRALLITVGADTGDHAIFAEWVAWGLCPRTMRVMTWGLQYRAFGDTPEDSIQDPELWAEFGKALDGSRWRHPRHPGAAFGFWRGCIDTGGHHPEVIRAWTEGRFQEQLRRTGVDRALPFGAAMLPIKSKARETGDHPVDLRLPAHFKRRAWPLTVPLESNVLKDAVYESLLRDGRLPEGVERSNIWPTDAVQRGYTPSWFKEMANEEKSLKRTARGALVTQWLVKHGHAKKNEAWDARIYATAAAMVQVYPLPIRDGLLRLALREAQLDVRRGADVPAGTVARLQDAIRQSEGYASNVVPLEAPGE